MLAIVSANAEWGPTKKLLAPARIGQSPYGEWFVQVVAGEPVLFLHGGWGKIAAAASAEYAITRWKPRVVINLGTVGGIAGRIQRFDRLLATRTIVYDIEEAMGDSAEAIADYSTTIDLAWLDAAVPAGGASAGAAPGESARKETETQPAPRIVRAPLLSGDRDLVPAAVEALARRFPEAVAADWESGAIAYVAARRRTPVLIFRGVSDLVSSSQGEAAGNLPLFVNNAAEVMRLLLEDLRTLMPHIATRLPRPAGRR